MWFKASTLWGLYMIFAITAASAENNIRSEGFEFQNQRRLIDKLFKAVERSDFIYLRTLVIPEIRDEVPKFISQLNGLVFPNVVLSHSFHILNTSKFYIDRGEHGTRDIMADVEICDRVTVYDVGKQKEFQKTFYLFYHFHFDRESGDFNILAPIKLYAKESNCTP